jgi:hypothetical protein
MSFSEDSPQHLWLGCHLFAYHEEGCLYLRLPQDIEHRRC